MTLALPTRRATLLAPPWAPPDLWRRAQAVPSLDLRFAERKDLVDVISGLSLITYTRASSGTFVGSGGLVETAGTNVPRFDHNPITGECLGLLVEEQRTNSIRNNTMVGAVAGTPGTLPTNWASTTPANGIAREIVGTGTENGIAYIDVKFSGTNTLGSSFYMDITFDSGTITAAQGEPWIESCYVKLIAGTITGAAFSAVPRLTLYEVPSFAASVLELTSATSDALVRQRYSVSRTLTGAATTAVSPRLSFNIATGGTIDFTLRIGLPQLELGAFATSVIPTTTAAVTRSADVVSITGTNFSSWYRQDEGTVFADVIRTYSGNFPNYPNIYRFNNGTIDNEITLFGGQNSQFLRPQIRASAAEQLDFISFNTLFPGPNRSAHSFATNQSVFAANGALTTPDTSVSMPTVDRLNLGVREGQQFTGCYRRLTYWPQRLSNSALRALTR